MLAGDGIIAKDESIAVIPTSAGEVGVLEALVKKYPVRFLGRAALTSRRVLPAKPKPSGVVEISWSCSEGEGTVTLRRDEACRRVL